MDKHNQRRRNRRLYYRLVVVAMVLMAGGVAALVALHGDVPALHQDNRPVFAGGEPVNTALQAVYVRAPLGPPARPDPRAWPQFGADAAHSFAPPGASTPLRGHVAWFAPLGGPVMAAPVVAGGTVYVSGTDGFLYALNARTGALRWRAGLGDSLSNGSPALGGGRVYANGFGTLTLAFDAASGRLLWQTDNGHLPSAPPLYYRGLVLVPSDGNFVSCYDARTGRLYWRFQSEDALEDFWPTTGAAAARGRTAYVALGASTEFDAIDLETGLKSWEYAVRERPAGAPALAAGAIYLAMAGGRLLCLDAASGVLRWALALPHGLGHGAQTTPLVAGGRLFIGGDDGRLDAVSLRSRRVLWSFATGRPLLSTPIVVSNVLYLPGGDGLLYALDAATGRRLWALRLGEMRAAPAYAAGTLYVSAVGAGGLYAIR